MLGIGDPSPKERLFGSISEVEVGIPIDPNVDFAQRGMETLP